MWKVYETCKCFQALHCFFEKARPAIPQQRGERGIGAKDFWIGWRATFKRGPVFFSTADTSSDLAIIILVELFILQIVVGRLLLQQGKWKAKCVKNIEIL